MNLRFRPLLTALLLAYAAASGAGSYDDFFIAVKNDDARTVRALLQRGFDPDTRSPQGLPGLTLALREPSPQVVRALLDWPKTDVNATSAQDETPLMMAALKGDLAVAQQLIARDAAVNKTGWTPLHYAATGGQLELIRLLLGHAAYIDAESPNGSTPLMMAARYGSPDAVRLLLEEGADPTLKNELGMTAIDFAKSAGRADAAELLANALRAWAERRR